MGRMTLCHWTHTPFIVKIGYLNAWRGRTQRQVEGMGVMVIAEPTDFKKKKKKGSSRGTGCVGCSMECGI